MPPKNSPAPIIDLSDDVAAENAVTDLAAERDEAINPTPASTPSAPLPPAAVAGAVPASEIAPVARPRPAARSAASNPKGDLARIFDLFPASRFKHLSAADAAETTRMVPCHVLKDLSGTRQMIKWYLKANEIINLPKWFALENPTFIIIKE